MSLSPRPERFTIMTLSLSKVGANFIASATASCYLNYICSK